MNTDKVNTTEYKHLRMLLTNFDHVYKLNFSVSFVTEAVQHPFNLRKILHLPTSGSQLQGKENTCKNCRH